MKCRTKLQKSLVLSIFVVICTSSNVLAADDTLLNMLPGDCAFCVRINDLNGTLAKIDQYLTGVAPIGTAMLVNMQLAGILGDPMLTGIEMSGNFAIVGLADTQTVGLLVPVTNFAEFVKTNPNCVPDEGGITLLSAPNATDVFVMTEMASGKYALVVPEDAKANLATLKTALSKTSGSLAGKLSAAQAKDAAAAPVWAYVNLALLYEKFSPMVLSEMENAEQAMAAELGGGMEQFAGFYIKMYMEMFKEFAGDADSATIALTPEAAALTLDTTLRAKSGSELAQMLVADPAVNNTYTYTGYLDNNNAVNGLMKMNRPMMQKMYDKIFDVLAKSKDDPKLAEQTAKMKALTQKFLPAMGDEVALSFSYTAGKPPFKVQEVAAVKDSAAIKELMDESMKIAEDFYATMGLPMTFNYQPAVSIYKNATIDKITLSFPPSKDPNDPAQKAIQQMYGDNLVYTVAHSADKFYMTMGADSEADVKKLIDQNAAAPATGEVKAAFDTLQKSPYNGFVCSVNVIKLMTGLGEMMKNMGTLNTDCQGNPVPMPDIFGGLNVQSQSSLAMGGRVADGQIAMRTILPKQHLMEIVNAGMQIQQKLMPKQIAQPAPDSNPVPAPVSTPAPLPAPAPSK